MKIYHCSPSLFSAKEIQPNIHVGGLLSSFQAGLRKARTNTLYLYTFELTEDTSYASQDVGGYDAWLVIIDRAKQDGFNLIQYINKYEPDHTSYSYIVLNLNNLKLIDVKTIERKEIKQILYEQLYKI